MPFPVCPRCRRCHVGNFITRPGILVLFLADWEAECTEEDLDFQLRNQLPIHKGHPPINVIRFEGMPAEY